MKKKNNFKKKTIIRIILVLFFLSLSLLFFKQMFSFILTLLIIIIASLSKIYKRIIPYSLGFELVTFASIVFFFAHGFTFGLILSFLTLALSSLISGRFSQIFIFQFGFYIVIGLISIILKPLGIVFAGKFLALLYNILLHTVGLVLLRMPIHSSVITFAVNMSTNIIFFDLFGEYLIEIL